MASKLRKRLRAEVFVCALACAFPWAHVSADTGSSTLKFPSRAKRNYDFNGDWKIDLGGGNAQEGKDTWSAGYLDLDGHLHFKLAEQLKIHIEPMARLYGGRAQERYDDDSLDSRIGVYDAHAAFEPWSFMELKGGIHSQRALGSPMLVSGTRAFGGFQEILKAKTRGMEGRFVFQQVVPNSYSLNTEREKQEALPWFRTEHIEASGRYQWIEWRSRAGLYEWSDIPAKVVFESVRLGNAPAGTPTVAGSRFAYGHQGWFGGGELCLCTLSTVDFVGEYDRIHNLRAPGDSADAQMWGVGPRLNWKSWTLDFRYRSYFIESDATVASYNKSRLGNTNRIGENLEITLHFLDLGFSVYGEMYKARPINTADVQQRDMEQYYIGVETDYAEF